MATIIEKVKDVNNGKKLGPRNFTNIKRAKLHLKNAF